LISVSDKQGIVEFAKGLQQFGVEIISTGGTYSLLRESNVKVRMVSEVTGFPEILDGRVKTLHPKIHGGLLAATDNPKHLKELQENEIEPINLVVVNLYPFEQTISKENVLFDEAIEQIDIGGPAMLRSAAKNFRYTTVVMNPERYDAILGEMEANGGAIREETRYELAKEVFQHTAHYDSVISRYLDNLGGQERFPRFLNIALQKSETLRYGENPHQSAVLYGDFNSFFKKLHGKELSYNNIVDLNASALLVEEFSEPTVVIVKHTNPCGVGSDEKLAEAYRKAFATDTKSPYGGIVAVNRPLDMESAKAINEIFTEVVIAPEFPSDVLDFLKKKRDRRLVQQLRPVDVSGEYDIKKVAGGLLIQETDSLQAEGEKFDVVTKRKPTENEKAAMLFGWKVVKHVKSNAIVYARKDRTMGIGAGQMSRVDSSKLAVLKAKENGLDLAGTSVASDAYFPFADGLLEAVKAGATAVIEPGGSVRDDEVIRAADEHDIAMVFTGVRHFRH
jgi:phosphoribosylaminoimidazolecarboxamide formyltransferase/IMP cyclohydrolase